MVEHREPSRLVEAPALFAPKLTVAELKLGLVAGFVSFAGFDLEGRRAVVVLVNGTRWFSDLDFHLLDPTYPLADSE